MNTSFLLFYKKVINILNVSNAYRNRVADMFCKMGQRYISILALFLHKDNASSIGIELDTDM